MGEMRNKNVCSRDTPQLLPLQPHCSESRASRQIQIYQRGYRSVQASSYALTFTRDSK